MFLKQCWLVLIPFIILAVVPEQTGTASWYSRNDPGVGPVTASGEPFDDGAETCASWYFPFGTYVKVVNLENGKFVVCRVNDRGPRADLKRIIDLSKASFEKISDPKNGVARVAVLPLIKF